MELRLVQVEGLGGGRFRLRGGFLCDGRGRVGVLIGLAVVALEVLLDLPGALVALAQAAAQALEGVDERIEGVGVLVGPVRLSGLAFDFLRRVLEGILRHEIRAGRGNGVDFRVGAHGLVRGQRGIGLVGLLRPGLGLALAVFIFLVPPAQFIKIQGGFDIPFVAHSVTASHLCQ